jgi:hypothetical protein
VDRQLVQELKHGMQTRSRGDGGKLKVQLGTPSSLSEEDEAHEMSTSFVRDAASSINFGQNKQLKQQVKRTKAFMDVQKGQQGKK